MREGAGVGDKLLLRAAPRRTPSPTHEHISVPSASMRPSDSGASLAAAAVWCGCQVRRVACLLLLGTHAKRAAQQRLALTPAPAASAPVC
jgi:hypothetical protein